MRIGGVVGASLKLVIPLVDIIQRVPMMEEESRNREILKKLLCIRILNQIIPSEEDMDPVFMLMQMRIVFLCTNSNIWTEVINLAGTGWEFNMA